MSSIGQHSASAAVAGVDGCPGGWAIATLRDGVVSVERAASLKESINQVRTGELAAIAIDMPIGLLDDRSRASDREARALLGPRRSSVFATPVRATLDAVDYADACDRSRAVSGKALSKQAFHLLPKIAEVDRLIEPGDQDRIVEAHPECAFTRLAGAPLEHPKATAEGRALRRNLLANALRRCSSTELDALIAAKHVPITDLLDALVLIFTARHVVAGTEERLGGDIDSTGLRAEIVY